MRDVLAALQALQEHQEGSVDVVPKPPIHDENYAVWFVGPRNLYHWLFEEVEEGFFIVSEHTSSNTAPNTTPSAATSSTNTENLTAQQESALTLATQPRHISRTLCTEQPLVVTCAEGAGAELHEWDANLVSVKPVAHILDARKLLGAITEQGLRLEYPIFVAVPGMIKGKPKQSARGAAVGGNREAEHVSGEDIFAGGHTMDSGGLMSTTCGEPETETNNKGVAFLGLRTLAPGDENHRPALFAQGLHVLETFDVSATQTLPYGRIHLPTLLGPSERDEVEVTARFELVSPNLNGHNLRWARGPFCALDLTFTLLPEGNLFPLQYPGTWEAVVLTEIEFHVRGESEDDAAWPQIRLLKYLLSMVSLLEAEKTGKGVAAGGEAGSSPVTKRARLVTGGEEIGEAVDITGISRQGQRVRETAAPGVAESAAEMGRGGTAFPTSSSESAATSSSSSIPSEPLVPLDMEAFLKTAAYADDDFVDLLWQFLAKHLAYATAASMGELKASLGSSARAAPSARGPGGVGRGDLSGVGGRTTGGGSSFLSDSFLFPTSGGLEDAHREHGAAAGGGEAADSPTATTSNYCTGSGTASDLTHYQQQEDAWRRAQALSDGAKLSVVVATLRSALRAVFQHLNAAGMPYIRKNNESELAGMISEYLLCFTRERRYKLGEDAPPEESAEKTARADRKRRFLQRLQFLERGGGEGEGDLAVLRLFADAALEAGREACRRYKRNLGFDQDQDREGIFRRSPCNMTGARPLSAQYLWLRSEFHVASLADVATRGGVPWEATTRLVRKAGSYYGGAVDRCRNLPVFALPLSRVAATKLVGKCVPYVKPCFARVAGRNKVIRVTKEQEGIFLGAGNGEGGPRGDAYSVTTIEIRKFVEDEDE